MKPHPRIFLWFMVLLLAACGHDHDDTQAERAHVSIVEHTPGSTPFIRTLVLGMERAEDLARISYTITPKPGTHSKPVAVAYERAWLDRRNAYVAASRRLSLPVFGLYANHTNIVAVDIAFADGSVHHAQVTMETPAHTAADAFYGTPTIRTARTGAPLPGLDFIEIHSAVTTPVVIDSDGNLRWVATGLYNSLSTLFSANGFFVGSPDAPLLYRMELDGALSSTPLAAPTFTNFHHDLVVGKNGLLAEVDALDNGVANLEAILAELSPSGQVLKQWNMAQIFRDAMLAGGDDPSNFVRDGLDWFHMNSAIYSRADDALYVSSRENFVVKLDYETGRILWLLGDTSKHWYTYPSLRALALRTIGGNPPVGQHSLSLDADGKLLLFNNGSASFNHPAGTPAGVTIPYSAPVKYAIDDSKRTATATWTFEHDRNIFSDICSSVFDTGSATYLVTYSVTESRTHARLVGLDQAGNVAFDFDYPTTNCSTAFLAKPFPFDALSLE
ncbi:aryl-sulfate sulfotransferase [Massilia sp. YIM B02763]|uniref:aryl-sulfate sulfotransferase n=1 Tax=Massilia sp. YIM B02763 TaxID=3050130 RepID=UPI0025B70933|nr:aryl-sulfate sulfotransferase [Massilia sp. YIM B02763]MDN4055446.1 aryl-sulfate sulfotransferase [Massilia sp. YIM B02763]